MNDSLRFGRSRALDVRTAGKNIANWFRELERAQRKCDATRDRRAALPAGSSRAKITTANARWMSATEHRDRCEANLRKLGVSIEAAIVACYGEPGPREGSTLDKARGDA